MDVSSHVVVRTYYASWRGNVLSWIFCAGVMQNRGITMSTSISKIKLINFKRFRNYVIEPNNRINILVGDNEVGKSSVLEAIDLVASGNVRRVEAMGLDRLISDCSKTRFISSQVQTYPDAARRRLVDLNFIETS